MAVCYFWFALYILDIALHFLSYCDPHSEYGMWCAKEINLSESCIPEALISLSSDLSGLLQLKQTRNEMWLLTNLCGGHQLSREFGVSVGLQGQVSLTALWVLQLPVWFASWHWRWSWRCWYQKKEPLVAVLAAASSLLLGKQGCWWNYLDAEGPSCNHLAS